MTIGSDEEPSEPATRPRTFFDLKFGLSSGRIVFELYSDVVPKTAENFRSLCTGEKGIGRSTEKALWYKNVIVHRVVKDFMIQSGDFSANNGTGGESIYGGVFDGSWRAFKKIPLLKPFFSPFPDEGFNFKHDKPFLLSMANRGKNTNGSQFFM